MNEPCLFEIEGFESARLKFKAHIGCLGLQEDLLRWKVKCNESCPLCNNGREDIYHFLFTCPVLNEIRNRIWMKLETSLAGGSCFVWETFISASLTTKLCFLLGDIAFDYSDDVGWIFDKACKHFLYDAWTLRRDLLDGTHNE